MEERSGGKREVSPTMIVRSQLTFDALGQADARGSRRLSRYHGDTAAPKIGNRNRIWHDAADDVRRRGGGAYPCSGNRCCGGERHPLPKSALPGKLGPAKDVSCFTNISTFTFLFFVYANMLDSSRLPGPPLSNYSAATVLLDHGVNVAIGVVDEFAARNTRFDAAWVSFYFSLRRPLFCTQSE